MLLADFAIPPAVEGDLRWFFCFADGDLGLSSNFGAMVAQLELGVPAGNGGPVADYEDRMFERLKAARAARRIERALKRVDPLHREILWRVFGPDGRPLPGLGTAAPLALETRAAASAHRASKSKRPLAEWLVRLAGRPPAEIGGAGALAIEAIRREVDALAVPGAPRVRGGKEELVKLAEELRQIFRRSKKARFDQLAAGLADERRRKLARTWALDALPYANEALRHLAAESREEHVTILEVVRCLPRRLRRRVPLGGIDRLSAALRDEGVRVQVDGTDTLVFWEE